MPTATRAIRRAVLTLLAVAPAAAAACGHRPADRGTDARREQIDSLAREAARLATSDTTARTASPVGRATVPLAVGTAQATGAVPDSLRIVSTDGAVVYSLVRDTVRMQLGDTVLREVRRKMQANTDSATGNFGNLIARTVAGAVGSAMTFVAKTPVRDIRSASYEGGELKIETRTGLLHGNVRVNSGSDRKDGKQGTVFAPADAERFVAAVQARRRALGVE